MQCPHQHAGECWTPGAAYARGRSWVCWLFNNDDRYNRHWGGKGVPTLPRYRSSRNGPCLYLGDEVRDADGRAVTEDCQTCPQKAGKSERLKVLHCGHPSHAPTTTASKCQTCHLYEPRPIVTPLLDVRLDGLPAGQCFNPSLTERGGELVLCYRKGWSGSTLHLCGLDGDYRPTWHRPLVWPKQSWDSGGREDPRLFWHDGRLHLTYSAVQVHKGQTIVRLAVARLRDGLQVERAWVPQYAAKRPWEKNWSMFSHGGGLFCVYSVSPHRVLRLTGEHANPQSLEQWQPPWSYGEPRGGACPVLVGDEYWSFHHWTRTGPQASYAGGLYTFDAKPPHKPRRTLPGPLLMPDRREGVKGGNPRVVFPGGAVLRDGRWLITYGAYDRECRLAAFDHAKLDALLVPVA